MSMRRAITRHTRAAEFGADSRLKPTAGLLCLQFLAGMVCFVICVRLSPAVENLIVTQRGRIAITAWKEKKGEGEREV